MKRCLVMGGNGLVGQAVTKRLAKEHFPTTSTSYQRGGADLKLNLLDKQQIRKVLQQERPEVIYHCANMAGGANRCQENPKEAYAFHTQATIDLIKAAQELNRPPWIVFFSSDYVFGDHSSPVDETILPSPLNIYGRAKMLAEEALLSLSQRSIIIRTTNVFGLDPQTKTPNFFMQILNRLLQGSALSLSPQALATPTYVHDLAECAFQLAQLEEGGVYHVVGETRTNRYQWARKVAKDFNLPLDLIQEQDVAPDKVPATPRPQLVLDQGLVKRLLGYSFRDLDQAHLEMLPQVKQYLDSQKNWPSEKMTRSDGKCQKGHKLTKGDKNEDSHTLWR